MAPISSQMTLKRIHREMADVAKEDLGLITLVPTADNLFVWKGSIPGPQGSPYEGGVFGVDVVLGNDYPFSAPKVTFSTRIYHMNISDRGNICIDILKSNWSPALSLFKVMLSLSSLLTDPNPVPTIATEFVRNRAQHDQTARQWTEMYAKPPAVHPTVPAHVNGPTMDKSEKGKEKARADTNPSASSSSSNLPRTSHSSRHKSSGFRSTSQQQPTTAETITIDDSDSDFDLSTSVRSSSSVNVQSKKGKGKRKRDLVVAGADEVVDLTDEDGRGDGCGRTKKRRSAGSGNQAGRSWMQTGPDTGDVIVIDD